MTFILLIAEDDAAQAKVFLHSGTIGQEDDGVRVADGECGHAQLLRAELQRDIDPGVVVAQTDARAVPAHDAHVDLHPRGPRGLRQHLGGVVAGIGVQHERGTHLTALPGEAHDAARAVAAHLGTRAIAVPVRHAQAIVAVGGVGKQPQGDGEEGLEGPALPEQREDFDLDAGGRGAREALGVHRPHSEAIAPECQA